LKPESARWMALLDENLALAEELSRISLQEFLTDEKMSLVFEALVLRVGELVKRLAESEDLAGDPWTSAAKARDVVAHHYHRIGSVALFETVRASFPQLREALSGLEESG